jgi:hypothetical protein
MSKEMFYLSQARSLAYKSEGEWAYWCELTLYIARAEDRSLYQPTSPHDVFHAVRRLILIMR